jgi:Trypsin-co-occurring domain 1
LLLPGNALWYGNFMPTKLIELQDGTLVEVEVEPNKAQPISGVFADKVDMSFAALRPMLTKVCAPVLESWKELDKQFAISQAEVSFSVSFEAEGNIYIAKGKAGANLSVKFILKAKDTA